MELVAVKSDWIAAFGRQMAGCRAPGHNDILVITILLPEREVSLQRGLTVVSWEDEHRPSPITRPLGVE